MTDMNRLASRQQCGREITAAAAQLYRRTSAYAIHSLTEVDLSKGKHAVLRILGEQDGLSLARIADKGALDRGNVTRIVAALEKDGYLSRQVDPAARHGYQIFLTEKGRAAIESMNHVIDEWCDELLADVDDKTLTQFATTLIALARKADEIGENQA
jgi:DNA-binding MarR family transcriptional regulator